MAKAFVREYRPEDRDAVRRICFETGLMGDTIAPQYSDLESFADMLTAYYTDAEPEGAWVAEADGKVVGYMLSCFDSKKAWDPGVIALKHALLRGLWLRPGTAWFYWRGVFDLFVDVFRFVFMGAAARPKFDRARYLSHTHNNLLPEGRSGGLSKEFFYRAFDRVKRAGSRGLYGEVWSANENMVRYLEKLGYRRVGKPYRSPGLRHADGSRVSMQLVLRDLDDWEPGVWPPPKKY
jgi:RimJ/RimL family protein N-acetyltransferase